MPPKAAQKTPTTGGKAPAGKAPAEKKEAGKKTAAPSGEKKKRTKSRKETYSSYIYKGEFWSLTRPAARNPLQTPRLWIARCIGRVLCPFPNPF
jgi:hypothetical protein